MKYLFIFNGAAYGDERTYNGLRLAGALSMVAIMKLIVPKHPKLAEYSLGIAMVIGMFFAVMHDLAVA